MEIVALLYIAVYIIAGIFIARLILPGERGTARAALALSCALALLMWLPALFAFVIGFTVAAQYAALGVCAVIAVVCGVRTRRAAALGPEKKRFEFDRRTFFTCAPIILVIWVLMWNHIITPASDGALHSGQSTYGDMCMHLGFITSISVQEKFPPDYSIMSGVSVGYPFLCDSVSSTFYTLGTSLRFASLLPMLLAAVAVTLGVYALFETWLGRRAAPLATYMFFVGGGFGFAYFFDLAKTTGAGKLTELMHGFYQTPTNQTDLGLRWVNPIADMLVPQRATLFGWSLLFTCLTLLYRAVIKRETRLFYPLGVLAGALPLVHTHSFLALGLMSAFLLVAEYVSCLLRADRDWKRRILPFVAYGLIAVVLAAPQLIAFTFRQAGDGGFLRLNWNWANDSDSWLWFYIKNWGVVFLLLIPAFISARRESRLFFGGGLLIWAICEVVVFQPNVYDNNKLLFVTWILACGIVCEYLYRLWDRLAACMEGRKRISDRVVAALLFVAMFTSGTMTLAREYVSGDHLSFAGGVHIEESGYEVVSSSAIELAEYIEANTPADAVFLTAQNHNNAVSMLTGRSIVCGSPSFLYYHGLDYSSREQDVAFAYEQPERYFTRVSEVYGVDYVLIGPSERGSFDVNEDWFKADLECVYSNSEYALYALG